MMRLWFGRIYFGRNPSAGHDGEWWKWIVPEVVWWLDEYHDYPRDREPPRNYWFGR